MHNANFKIPSRKGRPPPTESTPSVDREEVVVLVREAAELTESDLRWRVQGEGEGRG